MQTPMIIASLDEAYSFLVQWSREIVEGNRQSPRECNVYLYAACKEFVIKRGAPPHNEDPHIKSVGAVFHSAAWELCLKGVLRPGAITDPMGSEYRPTLGSHFSVTERGKMWLLNPIAGQPFSLANSAMQTIVESHRARFGDGFYERAVEAIACLENGTYLAACVMCGAAVESILLVTAVAICNDEALVLKRYRQASGREELRKIIIKNDNSLSKHIDPGFAILSRWRDEAAHGQIADIGHAEALVALYTVISLAQHIGGRWDSIAQSRVKPQI